MVITYEAQELRCKICKQTFRIPPPSMKIDQICTSCRRGAIRNRRRDSNIDKSYQKSFEQINSSNQLKKKYQKLELKKANQRSKAITKEQNFEQVVKRFHENRKKLMAITEDDENLKRLFRRVDENLNLLLPSDIDNVILD